MSSSRAPEGTSSRSLHYFQLPSDLKWNMGRSSTAHPHRRSTAQRHPPSNSTPPPLPLRRQHFDSGAASAAATPAPPSSNSSRGKSPMQVNDQSSPTKPEANLLMQMSRHASIELADDEDETLRSIKRVVTESRRSNNQKNNSSSSKKGLVINPSSTSSTPTSVAKKSKVVPPPKEPLKDGSAVKKPKLLIKIANKDKKQEPNNNNNSSSPKIEKSTNTVNGGGEDGPMNEKAVVAVDEDYDGKIWNLRPRRANVRKGQNDVVTAAAASNPEKNGKANCRSGEKEEDQKKGGAAAAAAGGGGEKKEKKEKISFSVSLTKKEIEEDIYAMTGGKPSRRPRKRAKNVQKQLDVIFPGLYLG